MDVEENIEENAEDGTTTTMIRLVDLDEVGAEASLEFDDVSFAYAPSVRRTTDHPRSPPDTDTTTRASNTNTQAKGAESVGDPGTKTTQDTTSTTTSTTTTTTNNNNNNMNNMNSSNNTATTTTTTNSTLTLTLTPPPPPPTTPTTGGVPMHLALSHVSFRANAGEKIALVGTTGAGKSTLLRLLFRFYDPDEGAVRMGGYDARRVQLASWRRAIAVVPQDMILFHDTIRHNIRYGRLTATDAEVEEVIRERDRHTRKRQSERETDRKRERERERLWGCGGGEPSQSP